MYLSIIERRVKLSNTNQGALNDHNFAKDQNQKEQSVYVDIKCQLWGFQLWVGC